MVMLRKSSLPLQNCLQFYKLINHAERASNQIIYFTRFIRNSGCIIGGCCFSRQSDEGNLLPKNSHEVTNIQVDNNKQPHSIFIQRMTNFLRMKRSHDSHDEISSQHIEVNSDLVIETCSKKQKTEDIKNDSAEEIHCITAPVNKKLDLPKDETVRSEIKRPETVVEKPKKLRPNYFVAVKISDAQIHKALDELQQHILDKDQRLRKSMIQLTTLHITLMVMHIGDTETHAKALKTLQNIHKEHDNDLSQNPMKLEFKGLGNFQNRVLFAKLSEDESYKRLSSLAESVKKHYSIASIFSTDSKRNFTPHLTVAKVQDAWKKNVFPKKIHPSLYEDFRDNYFGSQEVQSIQLLSMTDPKDEAGYYSGTEIYFSAFEPKIRRDYLNKVLETEKQKKNVKELINALMKEKLK